MSDQSAPRSDAPTGRSTSRDSAGAPGKQVRDQVRVGRLTKAHGLKGALKVELYTDDPERRFTPGAIFDLQVPTSSPWHGKTLELVELRFYNGSPVGFFAGISDRNEAETLVKAILWVDQDPTQLPDEQDAWYDYQLVGLRALRDGIEVGTVKRVDHLPAQDLLAIATASGEVLVPFVAAIVPSVDIDAGTVTLTPPAGLFEELPDDEPEAAAAPAAVPPAEPAAVSPNPATHPEPADPEPEPPAAAD